MQILKLIMGRDEDCLLCRHPGAGITRRLPDNAPLPWLLCPTHYGELIDDPAIREMMKEAEGFQSEATCADAS